MLSDTQPDTSSCSAVLCQCSSRHRRRQGMQTESEGHEAPCSSACFPSPRAAAAAAHQQCHLPCTLRIACCGHRAAPGGSLHPEPQAWINHTPRRWQESYPTSSPPAWEQEELHTESTKPRKHYVRQYKRQAAPARTQIPVTVQQPRRNRLCGWAGFPHPPQLCSSPSLKDAQSSGQGGFPPAPAAAAAAALRAVPLPCSPAAHKSAAAS